MVGDAADQVEIDQGSGIVGDPDDKKGSQSESLPVEDSNRGAISQPAAAVEATATNSGGCPLLSRNESDDPSLHSSRSLQNSLSQGDQGMEPVTSSAINGTSDEGAVQETPSSYHTLEAALKEPQQRLKSTSPTPSNRSNSPPKVITTTVPLLLPALSQSSTTKSKQGSQLRRGKWTVEEEAYVARVIQDFNSGFLDAPAGTTLRTYLSEKLECDPMRITKKFTGDACIGKRVFHPAVRSPSNSAAIDKAQAELDALERRWRRRLEMQQRESAKKAAASAAAAAMASGRNGLGYVGSLDNGHDAIAQTASWLDRAKSVLKEPAMSTSAFGSSSTLNNDSTSGDYGNSQEPLPKSEIMSQMQEVERLLQEGPIIQNTSAELPQIVDRSAEQEEDEEEQEAVQSLGSMSEGEPEPADKRLRTGAEDAEALVGFLRSVRASAAAGHDF